MAAVRHVMLKFRSDPAKHCYNGGAVWNSVYQIAKGAWGADCIRVGKAPDTINGYFVYLHFSRSQKLHNTPSHSTPSAPSIVAPRRTAPRICAIDRLSCPFGEGHLAYPRQRLWDGPFV